MRLARLAAVGLTIGVIAGFAVALLRARPRATPLTDIEPGLPDPGSRAGASARALELRAQRQVHG